MITEKQVIDFLKTKDNSYIENLMSSLTHQDSVTSHDTVGICPCLWIFFYYKTWKR